MTTKVFVNIYNKGRFLGMNLPVYNFPMDKSVVKLLQELGFQIEIIDPKTIKRQQEATNTSTTIIKNKIDEKVKEELKPEEWMTHDVYTMEELQKYSKTELAKILNYRGHYSRKIGQRDSLAPKYADTKMVLIQKVLETNVK